jgi:hypothetical protein
MKQDVGGCAGGLITVSGECQTTGFVLREHKRQRCEGGKTEHDAGHGVPVLARPQYEQDITHRYRNRSSKGGGQNDMDICIGSDQDVGKKAMRPRLVLDLSCLPLACFSECVEGVEVETTGWKPVEPIGWKLEDFFRNTENLQTQYSRSRRKDLSALSHRADALTRDDAEQGRENTTSTNVSVPPRHTAAPMSCTSEAFSPKLLRTH